MAEQEVLEVILHMARQLIWLDVACICAWVAASINLLALGWVIFRRTRGNRGGKHGVH